MKKFAIELSLLLAVGYGNYYNSQGGIVGRSYTGRSGYTTYYSPGGSRLGSTYPYSGKYQYRGYSGQNMGYGATPNWNFK